MSRPKEEIKPKPAKRLKTLLIRERMSQNKLANCIHASQQTISKIINGKCNLTENNARLIIGLFPLYRFEWLMGYDDIMLQTDLYDEIVKQHKNDFDETIECIRLLAKRRGIVVQLYYESTGSGGNEQHIYKIIYGEKKCYLNYSELLECFNVYSDLFELKINRTINNGDGKHGNNT